MKLDGHVSNSTKYQHSIISSGGSTGLRENRLLRSRGGHNAKPDEEGTYHETASDRIKTETAEQTTTSYERGKGPGERQQDLKVRALLQSDHPQQIATVKSTNQNISKGRGGVAHGASGKQRASPQKQYKPGKDGSSVGTVIMSANEITLNRPLANK